MGIKIYMSTGTGLFIRSLVKHAETKMLAKRVERCVRIEEHLDAKLKNKRNTLLDAYKIQKYNKGHFEKSVLSSIGIQNNGA